MSDEGRPLAVCWLNWEERRVRWDFGIGVGAGAGAPTPPVAFPAAAAAAAALCTNSACKRRIFRRAWAGRYSLT
jgi:hypothetical protein